MANIGKAVRLMFVAGSTSEKATAHVQGNNKFYDMVEIGGELHSFYGRVPEPMPPLGDISAYKELSRVSEKIYPIYQWDSIYRQKVGKGYKDMTDMYKSNETIDSEDDIYAPIENKNIAKIVNRLQILAKEVVNANYKVSPYAITQEMIDEAQRYIDYATVCFNNGDVKSFDRTMEELFAVIPRKMDRVDDFQAGIPSRMEEVLNREQDLLDTLKGQMIQPVNGQKVVTKSGDKHTILEINGITMEECTPDDIVEIKKRMGNSSHLFVNAWKVSNKKQETAYKAYCKEEGLRKRDCRLLWHGTRSQNVFSILKTGLVLRPTNAVLTGSMLGKGLYFAPDFLKSRNYTSARGTTWASGRDETGFMILHAVAYGNPYNLNSFGVISSDFSYRDLRKLKDSNGNKYHSVHAHKGMDTGWSALKADEIVVYKEEQVMPLYLVEIR